MITVPWSVVVRVDIIGSILILILALWCAAYSLRWTQKKPEDIFRQYIFLLTLSIVIFAFSRSFGHLVKQLLLSHSMEDTWRRISPFSGAINTASFIVIFAYAIYLHRFQKIYQEMQKYKNDLELLVAERTGELREVNVMLENVLDSSNPIAITNKDFELIQANKAYYAIWPLRALDGSLVKCYDSRPGNLCHTDQCPLRKILAGETVVSVEASKKNFISALDSQFIVTAKPFKNAEGELVGIVENFQDITDRKRSEISLASERERLAVTLKSIGDGVITTDINGNVVLINRVAEELTGWSQQQAYGRNIQEVFSVKDEITQLDRDNPVKRILDSGESINFERDTILVSKDERVRNISDSGAPIMDQNNKIIGVVLVFRDVTEKKQMEKELFKIKNIESLGVLAGGIAHDYNNILASILGNINLALLDNSLKPETQKLISAAAKSSKRAKGLTQQLLTFSKGGDPVLKICSLPEIVKKAVELILNRDRVKCDYNFSEDLWLLKIDPDQVSQVIQNIVINACQAIPEQGKVTIACENVLFSKIKENFVSEVENLVKISICDNGNGMSQQVMGKIFDPYFSTKETGNGLGLTISLSVIKKHGGNILVKSEEGSGTTFSIFLPGIVDGSSLSGTKSKINYKEEKLIVLFMDDDEMLRSVAKSMLMHLGHEVILAKDGEEALRLYEESMNSDKPVGLTIMDLTIPGGMGGKDAVRKLQQVTPDAKVIVASGYSSDPVLANYKNYGFCASLIKPFELKEVQKVIGQVLS